jgi:hypothetical protein
MKDMVSFGSLKSLNVIWNSLFGITTTHNVDRHIMWQMWLWSLEKWISTPFTCWNVSTLWVYFEVHDDASNFYLGNQYSSHLA